MKCLLLLLGLLSSSFAHNHEVLRTFMTGYNEFSADIYRELLKSNSGNFIMCPLSLDLILTFATCGARGETAAELKTALRLPEDSKDSNAIFKFIASKLQSGENYTLSNANKMYVANGFEISDNFEKISVDVFNAEIENIDFSKNQEAARKINRWVEDKTHNKIKDLIKPDTLTDLTRVVLVNAIYYHGKWVKKFDTKNTMEYLFFMGQKFVATEMMQLTDNFEYYASSELQAEFLKLDYEGGDMSMHIVLPNAQEGLASLEKRITEALIPPKYNFENISVVIPKFKIGTRIEFIPVLKAMGVKTAFLDSADFGGIGANQEELKITQVIQKAFIEVEEQGTTAGAATEEGFDDRIISNTKRFVADHPFLFYLRFNPLNMNFFVGRFTSPANAGLH
ncbi:hypothetical protein ILUMI_10005 [Ignelater luminosus]|uniref:Serpin domain-containing protein n=1 Tax=Ignelater luminosus TaxID=2038154 RepID=A0A8K0CYX8_IGNLU|nr:hypothetical protein ILUMI_10005 [Ignelater luminosus]